METTKEYKTKESDLKRHREYYARNRDKILAKDRESRRWVSYYERHKDIIRAKALARYYDRKAKATAETRADSPV